jgi:hypothetical protein
LKLFAFTGVGFFKRQVATDSEQMIVIKNENDTWSLVGSYGGKELFKQKYKLNIEYDLGLFVLDKLIAYSFYESKNFEPIFYPN